MKEIARMLCPPLLWNFAHAVKQRIGRKGGGSSTPDSSWSPGFHGAIASWDEAVAISDGWESNEITERTLSSALSVRDGHAEFAQDTVIMSKIRYSDTILAFLLLHLSVNKNRIDFIDFGGSLGTNYFQNRKLLANLSHTAVCWRVVERQALVDLGREHFATNELSFFATLEEARQGCVGDSYLFSGSLQYVS